MFSQLLKFLFNAEANNEYTYFQEVSFLLNFNPRVPGKQHRLHIVMTTAS